MLSSSQIWAIAIASVLIFLLPTIIAIIRGVEKLWLVIVFNLLGIPTLLAGWVAAMMGAWMLPRRGRAAPLRQPRHVRSASRVDHDPGPLRGTPFESLARSGFWAEHQASSSSSRR